METPIHDLSHEEMTHCITAIASRGKHVTLNLTRLEEIAEIMKSSIESNWRQAYRELSIAYQDESRLMEMCWPLVLTTCY